MVHITGGAFKGLKLVTPRQIRATAAKVRLALYNILGSCIQGARVLDVFAGSGALGFEALSRGATFVAFVEADGEAVVSIRDNLARLEHDVPRDAWRLLHLEAERGIHEVAATESPFDLIFLDPPYRTQEGKKALNAVVECAILAPAGLLVMEHHQRTALPASLGPLRQCKRHRYGDTVLSFYRSA
ncbi:MAG: 16S rRNA (guanine(966)-N(2))-methyltransferase RsmD [Candidatus Omnitrophica bacterium]|nr:16S rRNA (guanine(966)-N(2))-methyltransferase RsmD [Candidatus Omnitrophota bacterium]